MGTLNSIGNILLPAGTSTIDVQSLLDLAMADAQQPLLQLQQQQSNIQTQSSSLQSIEGDINNLTTAVQSLTDGLGPVNAFNVTSSNSNVVTASADATAAAGSHTITVTSQATTSSYYTDPVASASTPISAGTFSLKVGSNSPVTVTVNNTDNTLTGLASAINNMGAGVTASVINDANGARLAIVSNSSGAPGDITISSNTTGLNFNKAVSGLNASLNVDGVPISSTSNTVTGVIPGVTLNLIGAAPSSPVSVNVQPDIQQATDAINQFVSAWNTVVKDLNAQFTVNSDGSGGGPLEADGTLRTIQEQLLSAISFSMNGNNGLVNLSSIGLNLNNDGTITLDSGTLSNALTNNLGNVQQLLQGTSGAGTNLSTVLNGITDPVDGSITLDLQGMSSSMSDLTNQINDMQANLLIKQQNLTAQYVQVQDTLQQLPQLQAEISAQLGSIK